MKANVVATAGKKRKDESSRTDGVSSLRCASTDKSKPEIEAGNVPIAQMTMKEEVAALKVEGGKLRDLVKKEQALGLEKARLDVARRIGLSV